jgi:putative transposase
MTGGPFIAASSCTIGTGAAKYVSIKCTERLVEAGVEPLMDSVEDSYDHALAETINGIYKADVIHRRGLWRSFEAVEFATPEWVDWFNNRTDGTHW